jgi:hypothetical protein
MTDELSTRIEEAEGASRERWSIYRGNHHHFSIEPLTASWGQELCGGSYPSKLDAIEAIISDFEAERELIAAALSRAKRMRRTALRARADQGEK